MSAESKSDSQVQARLRPAAPVPHARDLTTLQVVREFGRNPIEAFGGRAYRERYVYGPNWLQDFLLINDPDGVRHVLLDNASNYVKSVQVQRTTGPALGNGLFNAEGAFWRAQRRTAAPMFQARHVAGFAPAMADCVQDMILRWEKFPAGAEIDAADEMTRLTYDIISRTMFSSDVNMQYGAMSKAVLNYLETMGRVDLLTTMGLPIWVPTPKRLRGRRSIEFFRRELGAFIARRRAQLEDSSAPDDLLTLLMTARDPESGELFGENEIFDNVMTFIFAGHETTANALAWTFYLLSQFPDADTRVAEEARTHQTDDTAPLVYTRMVLEESMRLYPPAPIVSRDSVGPDTVGGIAIKAKTSVMISPWVLHRHKTLWEEPDYFEPERFAPGTREKIHRFAYLPFGGGPRICIGAMFAMQEALIVLSTVERQYRLELVPGHPVVPLSRLTLRPQFGLKMRLRRRQ